jgi:hypothetical protein
VAKPCDHLHQIVAHDRAKFAGRRRQRGELRVGGDDLPNRAG